MRNLTVSARVRPGRVAVLVDVNDSQWQSSCLRVIEYFTRLWGGCGNIIIPTDGKVISPLFWRILERFDPDYLDVYGRTGRDVEIEEPAKFNDAYRRHIAGWEQQIGEKSDPHSADIIRDNLRQTGLTQFGISAELQQELRDRLAPFYFQHWIVEAGSLRAASVPHHPHTDVLDVLPFVEHPSRVLRVNDAIPFAALWWASSFGCVNAQMEEQLKKINVEVFSRGGTPDDVKLLIHLGVKGYEDIETGAFLASGTQIYEALQSLPFRLSMAGLGSYRSVRHHDWMEPAVAVAGTTIQDFAFYFALSRMRSRVVWIPPSVLEEALAESSAKQAIDNSWYFVNDLASLARGNPQRDPGMKIVTVTLDEVQLEKVKARFLETAVGRIEGFQTDTPHGVVPVHPVRYYEANDVFVLRSVAVPNDGTIPLFETPLPKSFERVDPSRHRWLTELSISQYHLPRAGGPAFVFNFFSLPQLRVPHPSRFSKGGTMQLALTCSASMAPGG